MRCRSILFIGGSSGSGKTTLATRIAQRADGIEYVSASALIREALNAPDEGRRVSVVSPTQADAFQELLVERFVQVRTDSSAHILLDGHFVVPTLEGFHRLSPKVFAALGCSALVLVESPLELVRQRLTERSDTLWWSGELEIVAEALRSEHEHAHFVSSAIGVPLVILDSQDAGAELKLVTTLRENASA